MIKDLFVAGNDDFSRRLCASGPVKWLHVISSESPQGLKETFCLGLHGLDRHLSLRINYKDSKGFYCSQSSPFYTVVP